MKSALVTALLLVCVSLMVWTAQSPEAGASWRIGFVLLSLASVPVLIWGLKVSAPSVRKLITVAIVLRLAALPLAPTLSDDGHRYMWDGYLVSQGIDPYALTPREQMERGVPPPIPLGILNSPDYHSVYPPASQATFGAAVAISQSDLRIAWWVYKLLLVVVEMLGIWVLARLLPTSGLALYAWHPLVILEIAGQGHTEGLAIGLLSLGLAALHRQRHLASGALVALAGGVKLWPVAMIGLWGQGRPKTIFGFGAVLAVSGLAMASADPGFLDSLELYAGTFDFYSAPYLALKSLVWPLAGEGSGRWATAVLVGVLFLVMSVIAKSLWKDDLCITKATGTVVLSIVLCSPTLHPWHLVPALWGAVLIQEWRVRYAILWLLSWSVVTYLIYVGMPHAQPWATWIGWGGASVLVSPLAIPLLLQRRGRLKWKRVREALGSHARGSLLDLGAAEGYVGVAAASEGWRVTLADIEDVRRVDLPFVLVEDQSIPAGEDAFDASAVIFVLHHTPDPDGLLRETARVTSGPVLVWETTPRVWMPKTLLQFIDKTTNGFRPKGHTFPSAILRSPGEWESIFHQTGLSVVARTDWGILHPQTFWHLRPHPDG